MLAVALFALVSDAVVGLITYSGLSTTSLSPVATGMLTLTIMSVFLVAEFASIFLLGSGKS